MDPQLGLQFAVLRRLASQDNQQANAIHGLMTWHSKDSRAGFQVTIARIRYAERQQCDSRGAVVEADD